jgi:hypothetical protein
MSYGVVTLAIEKLPPASVFVEGFPVTKTGTLATPWPFCPKTFPATVMILPGPPEGPVELLLLQPAPISPAPATAPVVKTAINARFNISSLLEL